VKLARLCGVRKSRGGSLPIAVIMASRGLLIPMPTTLMRAGALIIGGGVVVVAANTITPRWSEARPIEAERAMPVAAGAGSEMAGLPAYMGTLHGTTYEIDVFMGRKGPEFTVKDLAGTVLARGLSTAELQERFPTVDPSSVNGEAASEYVEAPAETDLPVDEIAPDAGQPAEAPGDEPVAPDDEPPQR
jgi:hypothetical protein